MALHLPIGPLKTRSWLEPTSPLADDIATAPSGPVDILVSISVFKYRSKIKGGNVSGEISSTKDYCIAIIVTLPRI